MHPFKATLVGLCLIVACKSGKSTGGDGDKMKTIDVGDTGFTIEVPADWTIETPMKGFYGFKPGRGTPQIMEFSGSPETPEGMAAQHCEGRTVTRQETLGNGGVLVSCKGPSKMMQGVTTTKVVVEVPAGNVSLRCHYETDHLAGLIEKVCSSLRKK